MSQEKVEFILPSGIEQQKKLAALVQEAVKCKHEIDAQNSDIKIVKEDLKEQFGMDGATAGKYINAFYDLSKLQEQVTSLELVIANTDIISKYK